MSNKDKIRVLIVGAGEAGVLISSAILKQKDSNFEIVGFLDDDKEKINKKINEIRVLGKVEDIFNIAKDEKIEEILITIPSARGENIGKIILNSSGLKLKFKIIPRISEVLAQDFLEDYLRYIREIIPEDLLGGQIEKSKQKQIKDYSKGKTILITGAAGSIGSELSKQLTAYRPGRIIFYDWWENGMHELQCYIVENYPKVKTEFIIGDIKDTRKLDSILACYKPNFIFHAAAYKHVPIMEINPSEAVKNNILGTKILAELSTKHKVEKFVLVSTDKAVNPTNIMGATKRAAEKFLHILSESQSITKFFSVRFGNVVNSNGSAIPFFQKQIRMGGPITVTHPDMTRYFMTIPEAVHLILQAWTIGESNDLFVLDMGEPTKIVDLAKMLIILNGYIPEEEIEIKFIGLRPGEKLFEEILIKEEEVSSTKIDKVYRTKNYLKFDRLKFLYNLSLLLDNIESDIIKSEEIKEFLKIMISTYKPKINKP